MAGLYKAFLQCEQTLDDYTYGSKTNSRYFMEFCLKKRNIARKVSYVSINTNFTDAYHFIAKLSNKRTSNVCGWVFFLLSANVKGFTNFILYLLYLKLC